MKLNEFSKRIGVSLTKLRYYARFGVIQPERSENNYRELTECEAIDVYNALILRDFDISVEEISEIHQNKREVELFKEVDSQVKSLEEKIEFYELRLKRLKELQMFLDRFAHNTKQAYVYDRASEYILWSFSNDFVLSDFNQKMVDNVTSSSPFSYVALRVRENDWQTKEVFKPELGVAVLKKNIKKAKLEIPKDASFTGDVQLITYCFEKENMFEITKDDLKPIFDKAKELNVEVYGDLTGRFYISYVKNGKRMYCFVLGLYFREKNILTCE